MSSSIAPEPDARRLQVVVAHGHPIVREGTRRILEAEPGLAVIAETESLADALPYLETLRPDVLLVGVDPTEAQRSTFLQHLRAAEQMTHVIALDYGAPANPLPLLGSTTWLPGHISPAELIAGIRAVAGGRQSALHWRPLEPSGKPTARELEVLTLVQRGLNTRAIAQHLQTTPRTVHFHVGNLFAKLGARTRTEMVHLARQRGWLD